MPESWRPYKNDLDSRVGVVSKDGTCGVFSQYDPDSNKTFFYYAALKDGTWVTNEATIIDLAGSFDNDRLQSKCMNMAKGVKIDGVF